MAHDVVGLIAQYGLLLLFVNVLLEQAGAPMPAAPALVVAGALAAGGELSIGPILLGAMGLPLHLFLLLDGLASLLWTATPVALGYLFAAQIESVLAALTSVDSAALELVLALFALYLVVKWWRRRSLLIALRMSRITVQDLRRAMTEGKHPLVVDVRSKTSRRLDPRIVPGALLADFGCVDRALHNVPLDHELVIYCNCPTPPLPPLRNC